MWEPTHWSALPGRAAGMATVVEVRWAMPETNEAENDPLAAKDQSGFASSGAVGTSVGWILPVAHEQRSSSG